MFEQNAGFPIEDAADFKAWKLQHPNAAVLLEVIIFRWRVTSARVCGKPGKWAAFDAEQWCAWSKLSHDQYKRALKLLTRDGLVIRERHRFGGTKVLAFIQPTPRALEHQGKESDFARLGTAIAPIPTLTGAPTAAPISAPTDYTTIATIATPLSNQKSCDPPPCIAPETHGLGKINGGDKEKDNAIPFLVPSANVKSLPVPLNAKPHVIWETAHAESYPGSFTALTAINRKQLNDFVSKCPMGYGGNILEHAVRHWSELLEHAKQDEAAFVLPATPATGFLLKFIKSAVNLWLADYGLITAGGQVKMDATLQAEMLSTPAVKTEQVQLIAKPKNLSEKLTKAEVLAILNDEDDQSVSKAG